ncbi:MAG: hypothetical protein ACLGIR_08440 [Actinomycetes bacterium]
MSTDVSPGQTRQRCFDVVWQHPSSRAFYVVGDLTIEQGDDGTIASSRYVYRSEARTVPGFEPFVAFPDLGRDYASDGLLSMFDNRVMSPRRSDFPRYASALGLSPDGADPVELLARSGGGRATDTVQLVPEPERHDDGSESRLFLVSGVRHKDPEGKLTGALTEGDELIMRDEPDNEWSPRAVLLAGDGEPFGYVPNYLLDYLHKARDAAPVRIMVEHVNGPEVPPHLRVLARMVCRA